MIKKSKSCAGLVLFHGAGGDKNHVTLVAVEDGLSVPVFRHNFPYREKNPGKRSGPNAMKTLVVSVREAVEAAAASLNVETSAIAVGGRSLGGRASSVAVSEDLDVAGLVLLSYPLHPPGKPEKLRVEHFPLISCPVLIVQGKSDPFGKQDEFAEHTGSIAGEVTETYVKGAHDPKKSNVEIVAAVKSWLDAE